MLEGLWQTWYESGQLAESINYSDSLKDGLYQAWHENGRLKEESNWKNGNQDGLEHSWDEMGRLWLEYDYDNGKLLKATQWLETGELRFIHDHEKGTYTEYAS